MDALQARASPEEQGIVEADGREALFIEILPLDC